MSVCSVDYLFHTICELEVVWHPLTYIGKRRKCCVKWLQRRKKAEQKVFSCHVLGQQFSQEKVQYFSFCRPLPSCQVKLLCCPPSSSLKSSKIRKKMMKTLFTPNPKCDETMQHSASNVKINNLWFFSDRAALKKSLEQWKISKNIDSICLWSNFFFQF